MQDTSDEGSLMSATASSAESLMLANISYKGEIEWDRTIERTDQATLASDIKSFCK